MNHLHVGCHLKRGVEPKAFAADVCELLGLLHERELIEGYYLTRRAFAIAPPDTGEFLITVQFRTVEQISRAFAFLENDASGMGDLCTRLAEAIREVSLSLYRDYPDPHPK